MITKKTTIYVDEFPASGFGQEQKWGGIKPVNRIPTPLFGIRIKTLTYISEKYVTVFFLILNLNFLNITG